MILAKCDSKRPFVDPFFNPEDANNNVIDNQPGANQQLEWIRPKVMKRKKKQQNNILKVI